MGIHISSAESNDAESNGEHDIYGNWQQVPCDNPRRVQVQGNYCKWNTFYLWGKMLLEPTTKNAPSNSNEKLQESCSGKNRLDTQSPGKGGPVTCSKTTQSRWKNFFAQSTRPVGQKTLSSAFYKYEIHKGQHLYRAHKRQVHIHQCTCRLKKIHSI